MDTGARSKQPKVIPWLGLLALCLVPFIARGAPEPGDVSVFRYLWTSQVLTGGGGP